MAIKTVINIDLPPDELSIDQIAVRSYPDDRKKQVALVNALIALCKAGTLEFYGEITGWEYDCGINPYPMAKGRNELTTQEIVRGVIPSAGGRHCLIHKDNFKAYLQSVNQWPVNDFLLVKWWANDELQANVIDNETIKPRLGGYYERDKFAIGLVELMPELLAMKSRDIKKALQAKSDLFFQGYPDWWRLNPAFKKGRRGA